MVATIEIDRLAREVRTPQRSLAECRGDVLMDLVLGKDPRPGGCMSPQLSPMISRHSDEPHSKVTNRTTCPALTTNPGAGTLVTGARTQWPDQIGRWRRSPGAAKMNQDQHDGHLCYVWATEVDVDMQSLVAAAAKGDQVAWDAIVREFNGLLWSITRGFRLDELDASDVVQITWLRLVENLDRIADPEALPAWLATTVRRECLQLIRRTRHHRVVRHFEPPETPDPAPPVDHMLLTDERDAALWRKVAELSETCFRLLRVLMASPPPSYQAVAAALGMRIGSIGPTRQRCLNRLRELLVADEDGTAGRWP